MAMLRHQSSGREHRIRGRALIGRSPRADVTLSAQASSSEHASISWDGQDWLLRDLKSRNGTWINDAPVTGRTWRLVAGDLITFGDPEEHWCWADGSPPRASAVRSDGFTTEAEHQMLWLPDAERPEAAIYATELGWVLERDGQTAEVKDAQHVQIGEARFRLELPELEASLSRTRTLAKTGDIRSARALFAVSLDEEHVELSIVAAAGTRKLAPHAFYYMLLLLARARLEDKQSGLRDEDAGWVHVEELTRQLATDTMRLNVDICRARKLMDELTWFANPEELIQRRKISKQLRIGLSDLAVESGHS